MEQREIIALLAEFFRDAFKDDPGAVAEWFASGNNDIDKFVASLDSFWP